MAFLVINSGSSTIKAALFDEENLHLLWENNKDWQGDFAATLEKSLEFPRSNQLIGIGHRVVHGGELFKEPILIDAAVKKQIRDLAYYAPLHNPINLAGIETCERLYPSVPQFAVFDTAFHATLNEATFTYPIPYKYREMGIRRYGFHGISHAYCSKRALFFLNRASDPSKIIVCHLGAGASLCAILNGKSVDTTMGMTPLEGLMMGTRCGSVDPGILMHLIESHQIAPETLDKELNFSSGLLGISGISEDVRVLIQDMEKGNARAALALEMFIQRLCSFIAAMAASLGGIDILVFTAGIGENCALIRKKACSRLSFLGISLDEEANSSLSKEEREVSKPASNVRVLVIPTREEWEIAHQCRPLLTRQS